MTIVHKAKATEYIKIVEDWGFDPAILQRIGTFAILWGLFETKLELAIWSLRDEKVAGVRPTTDGVPLPKLIAAFAEGAGRLDATVRDVLEKAAIAATDLIDYRHSLIHGHMIPSGEMPSFLRNPRWHGEIRKRHSGEAYITENLLDMAIDCAGTLCRIVLATPVVCQNPNHSKHLLALRDDVSRAVSQANELRHLAAIVSDDKY